MSFERADDIPLDRKQTVQKPPPQNTTEDTDVGDIDDVVLDSVKEKKLLLKLDLAFVPIIMLTYLSCFLDRSNIGVC